jgi:preprotein translocase SecE subunit
VAKNMADRKKNATRTRSQTAESAPRDRVQTEKGIKTTPTPTTEKVTKTTSSLEKSVKTTPAPARETRREAARQETKSTARRDAKKPSTFARVRNSKVGRFVYDSYYELRYKVTWPTFQEVRNMTIMVLIISAALGIILGAADFGLYRLSILIISGK